MVLQRERPPVPSIVTRDVERLSTSLDALQTIVRDLKEVIVGRPDIDRQLPISSTIQVILDYRERKFIYVYSPSAITLSIEDYGNYALPPVAWTPLPFPQSTRIFAVGQSTQILILVRATDNPIAIWSVAPGIPGGAVANVNIAQINGVVPPNTAGKITLDPASVTALTSDYPSGAIPITGASGNVANASAVATLAANGTRQTWITGFEVTGTGATAANIVLVTVVGTTGGTLTYVYEFVAGVATLNQPLIVQFSKAIPSSAINTSIVVTCPPSGGGGTNNAVVAHGYQL